MEGLSAQCRQGLLTCGKHKEVAKGGALWTQGETAFGVAIVLSGKVMSQFEARSGRAGTIGFWSCGDVVGLGELGHRRMRQHTVRCLEASTFLEVSFADLDALMIQYPELAISVVRALSARLSWVTQLALGLETSSAMERICTLFVALSERFGRQDVDGIHVDVQLTNEQLAAIAGVTRQFANSTLQELREQGVIAHGRQLVLTDIGALRRLAAG